ncbi:FIST N-terminal domain-containing protein, partial [Parachlamydia acanthamoebae]
MSTVFTTSIVKEKDSHAAGEALGLEALKKMPSQKPDLAIIFGSPDYDYKKVFESLFKVIGEIQIIGCTSAGEFTEKEVSQGGIACAFITSDTHHFYTGIGIGLQNKQNEAIDVALTNFPKSVPNFPLQSAML